MAPKTKYTFENIINVSFDFVRKNGIEKLTARAIAKELNCSTMPIYSSVKNMNDLEEEVIKKSWQLLGEYQDAKRTDDYYLNIGLGTVLFARDEPHLYTCIQDHKHYNLNKELYDQNTEIHLKKLSDHPVFKKIPDDIKIKLMTQGFIFSHGLADLITKKLTQAISETNSEEGLIKFFLESNYINWIGVENYVRKMGVDI